MKMPKILIVDDDPSLQKLYETALKTRGYRVVVEDNGEKALSAVDRENPDLILLDVMMPNINGIHTLEILRATPETKKIKVIVLTALDNSEIREKAMNLGANDFIVKTQVTIGDIMEIVKGLLG